MEKVRLGIIGIGNMGTGHLDRIQKGEVPEMEVTAVCDTAPERLEWAEKNHSDIARFDDAEAMMDSGLIDAVLVAVPHYDHPKYSIMGMKKGLHVMCEKPAGVYTKQVKEMNEISKECNVKFGMMFNQRTNPIYRKLREIVQSGLYGEIRRTNWIITSWYRTQDYYDSGAWRATWSGEGGGVLLNQCPHQLDLWQWICGMPSKVYTKMHFGKWHDIEVEDDVATFVEYPNGATGTFITTTGDAHGTNRFEITLDRAKVICEGNTIKIVEFEIPVSQHLKTGKGFDQPNIFADHTIECGGPDPQHNGVLKAFAASILRDEPMTADGTEGINGLTLSNCMHLSAWLNKEIDVAELDDELYYNELMKRVATSRRKENVKSVVNDTSGTY
ncbi:MAG: Gfo/Idh/MocA family oxidoreductase [Clostridia bacterium]|nr:Gfo/Idh/MocA family oxidoreductase [Clostridia bacterium]